MSFRNYLWKSKPMKIQIILLVLIVLLFSYFLIYSFCRSMGFSEMWQNWMEAFISFATIIVASFIAYNEKWQDWENTLPNKLNAVFDYNGNEIFVIENAPLAGSNDIRQWGQQIAKQMNDNEFLEFNSFQINGPTRVTDETNKRQTMSYELKVWLHKEPKGTKKTWKYDNEGRLLTEN
jgi:hypothetical protein